MFSCIPTGLTFHRNYFQCRHRTIPQCPTYFWAHPTRSSILAHDDINAYDYAFSITEENITRISQVLQRIDDFICVTEPNSSKIGPIVAATKSISIVSHGVSETSLPTWHTLTINYVPPDKFDESKLLPCNDVKFAKEIHFLDGEFPSSETHNEVIPYLPSTDKEINFDAGLYLVTNKKFDPDRSFFENKCPDQLIRFSPRRFSAPRTRYFDPYDYNPSKLAYPILLGLQIEFLELDGFVIPQPSRYLSLHEENSYFLQSGLPLSMIHSSFTTDRLEAIERPSPADLVHKLCHALYDFSKVRLPLFFTNPTTPRPTKSLYGFHTTENIDRFSLGFNFFGFSSKAPKSKIPKHSRILWSPYRYLLKDRLVSDDDIYMLSSLRGIYGTNVTYAEGLHPSSMIPH